MLLPLSTAGREGFCSRSRHFIRLSNVPILKSFNIYIVYVHQYLNMICRDIFILIYDCRLQEVGIRPQDFLGFPIHDFTRWDEREPTTEQTERETIPSVALSTGFPDLANLPPELGEKRNILISFHVDVLLSIF